MTGAATTARRLALVAALLAPAPPGLAQPGPAQGPHQPRLPQVLSPLDPAPQGQGLPRVIMPMDLPPAGGIAPDVAPQRAAGPRPAAPQSTGAACTPQQVAAINAALAEAGSRIANGMRLLAEEPDHPHVRQWFGAASRAMVMTVLQRTGTRLSSTAGVELHCNDASRCVGAVTAYVTYLTRTLVDAQGRPAVSYRLDEGQVLGVCPAFFRAGMDGTGTRWGILIHEATHIAAATKDHVYGRAAALALARTDPVRALENADNYMLFIETLPRR